MKKCILILITFCFFVFLVGCSNNKVYDKENNIVVIESKPGESKSYFYLLDNKLNIKERIETKHSVIGTNTQSLSISNNSVYITKQNDNDLKYKNDSDRLLVYSLDTFNESNIKLMSSNPDSILVDKNNIYTSFNWDEGVFLYKQNKDGKMPVKKILDKDHNGRVENIIDMGEKISLVYENIKEHTTYIHILSKRTLDTIDIIPIGKEIFPFYNDYVYSKDSLYLVGNDQNSPYQSILTVVDVNNKKVINYKYASEDFVSIFNNKNKLTIFACDDMRTSSSKSSVYEFDKENKTLLKKRRYEFPISKSIKVNNDYITIGFDNICKLSKEYKIKKKVNIKSTYTNQIFMR